MTRAFVSAFAVSVAACSAASAQPMPTSRMLVEMSDLSGISISPDGRFVAYAIERAAVETNSRSLTWYVQPLEGSGAARPVAGAEPMLNAAGGRAPELPQWSTDSQWLYFRALRRAGIQVWRVRPDGRDLSQVTADDGNVLSFELVGNQSLVYEAGAPRAAVEEAEQRAYDRGILIDGSVPVGRPLHRSSYLNGRHASPRYMGSWLEVGEMLAQTPPRHQSVDLATGIAREATPAEVQRFREFRDGPSLNLPEGFLTRTVHATTAGVALAPESEDAYPRLNAIVGSNSGAPIVCGDPSCYRPRWFRWRPGSSEIVYASRNPAATVTHSLHAWNVRTGRIRLIARTESSLTGGFAIDVLGSRCDVGQRYAVCAAEEPNGPARLERFDLESGARHVLADPNRGLQDVAGPSGEFMTWSDGEGREFTGVYFPARGSGGTGRVPLFVHYYSCRGYLRGGTGDEWPMATLAASGIAVLCINTYSPRQPITAANQNAQRQYEEGLSGIRAAIELLTARGIDPARVGIGGLSQGSEVAMWTARHSDLLAAMSLATPQMSETYYWQRGLLGEHFQRVARGAYGLTGSPDEAPEQWQRLSPRSSVDRLQFPILLQLPEEEYLVAMEYYIPLVRAGAPIEMYVFPDEPHVKIQPRHKLAVYERNLDWFRFWLQGYEDPAPEKAEQYVRWRTLRTRSCERRPQMSYCNGVSGNGPAGSPQ
jgi:dipeptidyl aminopeptidase/acylaminoacyl peptidase